MGAWRFGELISKTAADIAAQFTLPVMEDLQPRGATAGSGIHEPEGVRLLQFGVELDGIIDSIDADLNGIESTPARLTDGSSLLPKVRVLEREKYGFSL